ncbi:MAG: tyrosine-type recombinase/integrase [Flavobacteriales bacterium]
MDHLSFQKRYSKHTVTAYRNDLYAFADFCETTFEISDLSNLNRRHISSFVAQLSEDGMLPRSINRKISAIQSLFEYAIRHQGLKKNPARNIVRPKTPEKLPSVLRSESIDTLFNRIEFADDFEGMRDRLMLTLFYACGLRREELINLNIDSIDFHDQSMKVLGKRNKERIIPVSKSMLNQIREYFELRNSVASKDANLFITTKGKKLYPSLVYKTVKNYLSTVTTMDKKSPHVLRHTFATHLLNEGANLQSIKELLGHSSLASTQVYTHTSLDKLKDVYRKSHPRNQKK